MEPTLGEAYWSLANLKTFRFSAEDFRHAVRRSLAPISARRIGCISSSPSARRSRTRASYERSFAHYAAGNAQHRLQHPYSADENRPLREPLQAAIHRGILSPAAAAGAEASPIPIFIVGLPRAGSTLIEQILASHPLGGGDDRAAATFRSIARELAGRAGGGHGDASSRRSPRSRRAQLARWASAILPRPGCIASPARPTSSTRCRTIVVYVGLIQLILPNAKIIDARRHPLGCCFSAFKQHFSRGQTFTYDLGIWAATMPTMST